jgi:hypothetical protein
MEQFNRKTKEEKNMSKFTTNWYLYKTYSSPISAKIQNKEILAKTNSYKLITNCNPKTEEEKNPENFEKLLLESIDDGFSLLGESAKNFVYSYLEKTFKIDKQEIPYKIEKFIDVIESIFGNGAKIIEIQIMKSLFKKVGCTIKHYPEQNNLEFLEYIEAIELAKKYENVILS